MKEIECGASAEMRALFIFKDNFCIFLLNYLKQNFMKQVFILLLLFFGLKFNAQKVFSTQYSSQAEVKVFVCQYESQADLKVYKVEYESQASGNEGKWFFTKYGSQAKKKIYFVETESSADLKIFFVKYSSSAGWRNNAKKHLMY
jgi:hypothetical protein